MLEAESSLGGSDAPWLSSAFRPLYLLGALYAPLLALGGAGAFAGAVDLGRAGGLVAWHGHEMLFGFASALIVGTLLTALPSWAGLPETQGRALAGLVLLWLAGRLAFWAAPWLPLGWVAAADLLLWLAVFLRLLRPLWRLRQRLYRLLPPVLLALVACNAAYHAGVLAADTVLAERALRAAVWTIVVLFSLIGGVLTPVFTGNALRSLKRGEQAAIMLPLETLALALLVALAAADLLRLPGVGGLAAGCAIVQAARVARWRGWRVLDQPLLPSMHLAFAWLIAALVLKALAEFGAAIPEPAWVHAFTVGALGMMMLGLMTRVTLRHTGRTLRVPPLMHAAAAAMTAAALMRLLVTLGGITLLPVALAAALWALALMAYAASFAAVLVSPSLPRT